MQKNTHDYDNVFKTMKSKHKRLFISVINDIFSKNYPLDTKVEVLPSDGYLTEAKTSDDSKKIEEQDSDFLIKIESEVYLIECQSYDDGSMAIRIAEYAFIVARQFATWDIGHAVMPMPRFSVIYVKKTSKTPKTTVITFIFPDGQVVNYESENVILEQFTKEAIIEKRLFPYIPFYIARYEKDLTQGQNIDSAIIDLTYFRDELLRLHEENELSDAEIIDLMGFVNTIVTHITNGNKNEERLVNIMGGTIIETESEKLIRQGLRQGMRQGQAEMIIEFGQEEGLDRMTILQRIQTKTGMSMEDAELCMQKYGSPSL
ncbi:MAG: hypothetical protein NC429_11015 [Lachnospiraceae bacterium]|nr:hypothetical protein [Lachnospiraceae bacterium]